MDKFFYEIEPGMQVWYQRQVLEVTKAVSDGGFTTLTLENGQDTTRGDHDQIKVIH